MRTALSVALPMQNYLLYMLKNSVQLSVKEGGIWFHFKFLFCLNHGFESTIYQSQGGHFTFLANI